MIGLLPPDTHAFSEPLAAVIVGVWILLTSLALAVSSIVGFIRKRRAQRQLQDARAHVMLSEAYRLGKRIAAEREWGRAA